MKVNEKLFKHVRASRGLIATHCPAIRDEMTEPREVHTTKHGLMRVYQVMNVSQESKDWVREPQNYAQNDFDRAGAVKHNKLIY